MPNADFADARASNAFVVFSLYVDLGPDVVLVGFPFFPTGPCLVLVE